MSPNLRLVADKPAPPEWQRQVALRVEEWTLQKMQRELERSEDEIPSIQECLGVTLCCAAILASLVVVVL